MFITPVTPAPSRVTKRCLADELDHREVVLKAASDTSSPVQYDIYTGDGDSSTSECATELPVSRQPSSAPSDTAPDDPSTPSGGSDTNVCQQRDDDGWNLDTWQGTSLSTNTSPCGAALLLDQAQRDVADAVLSELQIDLDAAMQRTMSQLSSWISEEIAFVRAGFEHDLRKAKLTVEADTPSSRDATLSPAVMEAQRVAEDRRRRLTLEMQDAIQTQDEKLAKLGKLTSDLLDKIDAHSTTITRNSKTLHDVTAQLTFKIEDGAAWQVLIDERLRQLQPLECRLSNLESDFATKVCNMATWSTTCQSEVSNMATALQRQSDELKTSADAQARNEQTLLELHLDVHGFRDTTSSTIARLNACESAQELASSKLDWQTDCLDLLRTESEGLSEAVVGGVCRADVLLKTAKDERLAELTVVCEQLGYHGKQLDSLNSQLQEQLGSAGELSRKIEHTELSHEKALLDLNRSFEQTKDACLENSRFVWMLKPRVTDVATRMDGLEQKLVRIVEHLPPDELRKWEACLTQSGLC